MRITFKRKKLCIDGEGTRIGRIELKGDMKKFDSIKNCFVDAKKPDKSNY